MREHFHNLQALRGVACLLVVGVHLLKLEASFGFQTLGFREVRWFGFAGVDLFFVLSGFIIASTNRQHLGRPGALPGYLFRRFWRIYPTYWAALVFAAALAGLVFGRAVYDPWGTGDWVGWLVLAPIDTPNAFVGQAWTLSYEVMFYLAFGALLLVPPRWAAGALCCWGVVVVAGLFGPVRTGPAGLPLSPFVLEFLGGCLVAWLIGRGVRGYPRPALALGLGYAAVGVVWTTAVVSGAYPDAMASQRLRVLVFGPAAILIVYGMAAAEGRWPRRVPGWLLRTGDASFSLYLLHPSILILGLVVGVRVPHTRLPHLLWLAGTFAAILATGFLFHARVERPLLGLGKSRRKPRPVAALAVADPVRKAAA
ncbi:MAG: acyltransferase 3 [Gemmataceae bacterium]|nr:acyltransferase 3 [Gemmataceae bacterium]